MIAISAQDFHIPHQDEAAIQLLLKFIKYIKPKYIFLGELVDAYSLSSFDKNPNRLNTLQEEFDQAVLLLKRIRKVAKNSRIIMLESNHDYRLERYLKSKAIALHSLRSLTIPEQLHLRELDIHYTSEYVLQDVLFKHGDSAGVNPAHTSYMKEKMNVVIGHTHRSAIKYINTRKGLEWSVAHGCLCDIEAVATEFIKGFPNWSQGFAVIEYRDNVSYPNLITIQDRSFSYGSKIFTV